MNITLKVSVSVTAALAAGSTRHGEHGVEIGDDIIGRMSPAQREVLAASLSQQQGYKERCYALLHGGYCETLSAASFAPEAVETALRAWVDDRLAETAARLEKEAAEVVAVLRTPPSASTAADALSRAADRSGLGEASLIRRLEATEEGRAWLAAYERAAAERKAERVREIVAAIVAAEGATPGTVVTDSGALTERSAYYDGVWVAPISYATDLAEWLAVVGPARVATVAATKAEEARLDALRRDALLAWAAARSDVVRRGTEAGYDQAGAARAILVVTIAAALGAEDTEPGDLEPRDNVSAEALDALARVRIAAERLAPELPPGGRVTVGAISRESRTGHSAECAADKDGACHRDEDCGKICRTVVPVRTTGIYGGDDFAIVVAE